MPGLLIISAGRPDSGVEDKVNVFPAYPSGRKIPRRIMAADNPGFLSPRFLGAQDPCQHKETNNGRYFFHNPSLFLKTPGRCSKIRYFKTAPAVQQLFNGEGGHVKVVLEPLPSK
jgi:hypothetical protein